MDFTARFHKMCVCVCAFLRLFWAIFGVVIAVEQHLLIESLLLVVCIVGILSWVTCIGTMHKKWVNLFMTPMYERTNEHIHTWTIVACWENAVTGVCVWVSPFWAEVFFSFSFYLQSEWEYKTIAAAAAALTSYSCWCVHWHQHLRCMRTY